MMRNYSFNGLFLDLDNVEVPQMPTKAKMMSDLLAGNFEKSVDVVKHFDWAMKIRRSGVLELDKSSVDELTKLVKDHQGLSVLVRRRLLECLENPIVEAVPMSVVVDEHS